MCRGLNCSNTKFISAHILPRGFSRLIRADPASELLKVAADKVGPAFPQLGETDQGILCADCDAKLGKDDGYAIDVCRSFQPDDLKSDPFEIGSVDADRFSKFILSFLWRASISTRGRYCTVVTFGYLYDPLAREVIFGTRTIDDIPAFKLFVSKLRSSVHDVTRIITDPIRFKFECLNAYSFLLGGFQITAVLDGQELAEHFSEFIINRTKVFRGFYYDFDGSPEHRRLTEMIGERR
jgi:hypothetical protein